MSLRDRNLTITQLSNISSMLVVAEITRKHKCLHSKAAYFGSLKSPPSQISYDLGHGLFKISYFIWSLSLVIFHQLWSLIGVSVAFQGFFFSLSNVCTI